MKSKKRTVRNPVAVAMNKRCKNGKHHRKSKKRKNGKNKQRELLQQAE